MKLNPTKELFGIGRLSNMKYEYKKDDEVTFDNGVIFGSGFIVGACNTGHPIIGVTYMVDVTKSNVKLPNKEYPFEVIPVNECHINKIEIG